MEAQLAERRLRALQLPAQFEAHGELRFVAGHVAPPLQHQRTVRGNGANPATLRSVPVGTRIPTDGTVARPRHIRASSDAGCSALAASEGARVVLSAGAFRCFADTLAGQEWQLSVTVQRNALGLLAVADGPELPARLSRRDLNAMYYKARQVWCKNAQQTTDGNVCLRAPYAAWCCLPTRREFSRRGSCRMSYAFGIGRF